MNINSRLTVDDVFALVFHILLCKQILCEEVYKLQLIFVSFTVLRTQEFHGLLVAGCQLCLDRETLFPWQSKLPQKS